MNREQRIEPEPLLVGGLLLLSVSSDQRSIDINDQRILRIGAMIRSIVPGDLPLPCAGRKPGSVDRGRPLIDVRGQRLDKSRDRRLRRHRPIQVGFVPERCGIRQGVTAKGESDREIEKNLRRIMDR